MHVNIMEIHFKIRNHLARIRKLMNHHLIILNGLRYNADICEMGVVNKNNTEIVHDDMSSQFSY